MSDLNESRTALEVGKMYRAKVIRATTGIMGGEALAKIDDFTVSVSSGAPVDEGEEVRVKITNVKGNTATANLVTNAADIF